MRIHLALVTLLLAAAAPAQAQLSPHAVGFEAGLSTPPGRAGAVGTPFAATVAVWLDGDVDVLVRAVVAAGPRTSGRGATRSLAGTAGLRWSLAPGPLRPQLFLEAGWARSGGGREGLAAGAGAGLEWFPARDLAIRLDCAVRSVAGEARGEVLLGGAAYF